MNLYIPKSLWSSITDFLVAVFHAQSINMRCASFSYVVYFTDGGNVEVFYKRRSFIVVVVVDSVDR